MSSAGQVVLADLLSLCGRALEATDAYLDGARKILMPRVASAHGQGRRLAEREQCASHGFAWSATYAAALAELLGWARRLESAGRLGDLEHLILQIAFAEYLAQMRGGIVISPTEIVRPADLGVTDVLATPLSDAPVMQLVGRGNTAEARARLTAELVRAQTFGDTGIESDSLLATRDHMRRYADTRIAPSAHAWHRNDQLIPLEVVAELAELGVFGLSIAEQYGGLGLGKVAMCLVTEELSRAFLGVGSLGTRSEIAADLIGASGTDAQKRRWLPGIASGDVLPTAVFTEPSSGSDLGAIRTRAVRDGTAYRISGTKTWITHAARADLMTLLARTGAADSGHGGLSIFLARKPRGTDGDIFPVAGIKGSEIPVLGYRGMKEYEMTFDDFAVTADDLLGGVEGLGFKQLMRTFESARIQTAARAVGVAQNALELGMAYAAERKQFDRHIIEFPRISSKIAWMTAETMAARQLTYFAARAKDRGERCDIEAGMAKLLAARVAWTNADSALQIHGGNGYAAEYAVSRVLCDARILSIFEGAAEIQADIVARGLLMAED